jgi:hypothetical protein
MISTDPPLADWLDTLALLWRRQVLGDETPTDIGEERRRAMDAARRALARGPVDLVTVRAKASEFLQPVLSEMGRPQPMGIPRWRKLAVCRATVYLATRQKAA